MPSYGGFWLRFVAYFIDAIILNIAQSVIAMPLGFGTMTFTNGDESAFWGMYLGVMSITFVMNWLYSAVLESSSLQGTLGKKALGLVVTDIDGRRISFGRATGRYFAKFLSAMILFVGFMMAGWTARKQGLHDLIAGTLVYKSRSPELLRNDAEVFE